jgi:beta-glucosidase
MKNKLTTIAIATVAYAGNLMAQTDVPQFNGTNFDEVIRAMTLEEKALVVVGTGMAGVAGTPALGTTAFLVPGATGTTQPVPRLGISAAVLSDGPAGLRISPKRDFDSKTYYCTHFPIGTCLSSSWNTELVYRTGHAIGEEALAYGVDVLLGPGNNIQRNPLCGRNFEYYSEDPVLAGNIAAAYIQGVQSNGVGTSLKHFAFNNQETLRMGNDARVSRRAAREIYLKAFQIAIQQGQPWTVMTAYNKINGTMTSESCELLTTVLREEWGFNGLVVTDWYGGYDPARGGKANRAANMQAGNDLIEPGQPEDSEAIIEAVKSGKLDINILDANVKRILRLIAKTPRFKGYKYDNNPDLETHAQVARTLAAEGVVLLKNNDILPLDNTVKKVAAYGCTSYDIIAGGTGSGNVNHAYTVSLIEGLRNNGYTVDETALKVYKDYLEKWKKEHANDRYEWYENKPLPTEFLPSDSDLNNQAVANDVAVITLGRLSGEGSDRRKDNFYLSKEEQRLIENVCDAYHKAGKKVVAVLNIGGVIETASWKNIPDAILLPWQSGQEMGNTIADILSGCLYPSGKLSMTWPVDVMDHYSSLNFPVEAPVIEMAVFKGTKSDERRKNIEYTNYEEGIYVGYRYFDSFQKEVSYPFGFGLSYTTFEYSDFSVLDMGEDIEIKVTITNRGSHAGKEVAGIYVTAPKGEVDKPSQELKAFTKTKELQPGESHVLTMAVPIKDLASFHEVSGSWIVDAGQYIFKVGASSRDIKDNAVLKLKRMELKVNNVLKPQFQLNILTLH